MTNAKEQPSTNESAVPIDPHRPGVIIEGVPEELRAIPRWICWKYGTRDGKRTKQPVAPRTGRVVNPLDPGNWCSFDEAAAAFERNPHLAGVGFVFVGDDDLCGVDVDDCIDDAGNLSSEAQKIVDAFGTYAEVSPSGEGLKLIARATRPESARTRSSKVPGMEDIEVYFHGRFFTVTGRRLPVAPATVNSAQAAMDDLIARFTPTAPPPKLPATPTLSRLSDEAVLERARSATNGQKFIGLHDHGDTSGYGGDDSAADAALMSILAFWTNCDAAQMERLFSLSALGQREKWKNRSDYRQRTIQFAIDNCRETVGSRPSRSRLQQGGSMDLPQIEIGTDEHRVADEVIEALRKDKSIFTRGGMLVRIVAGSAHASPRIEVLPPPTLREDITRHVVLFKPDRNGEPQPKHPPKWTVSAIAARGSWPGFRELQGLAEAPVLRPDGSIASEPGYDAATGLYLLPFEGFEAPSAEPTLADARAAIAEIKEVVSDFNFESEVHRSAFLAALLTLVGRSAIEGPTPLFLFDANIRGAGKTLLAGLISWIVLGRELSTSTYTDDSNELRKRITASAIAGDRLITLDNLAGTLGNDTLDRALTSTRWQDRVLGHSEVVDLPLSAIWFATGNNVIVKADTGRRVIHIRLDVMVEKPEERVGFRHPDLVAHVKQHRARLYRAALTILSAYIRAGRPPQTVGPMGSYEGWTGLVCSALVWCGLPDPCATRQKLTVTSDSTVDGIRTLFEAWQLFDPEDEGIVVSQITARLWGGGGVSLSETELTMKTAIEGIAGRGGKAPTARQIGAAFKGIRRRVVDGVFIDIDNGLKNRAGATWRLAAPDSLASVARDAITATEICESASQASQESAA